MYASIAENVLYSWLGIYPFLEGIHKHNCNEISFEWYNHLVFMKTGYEIKMTEAKSEVKW